MAAGDRVATYTDQILADMHTVSQAAETLLTSIDAALAQFIFDDSFGAQVVITPEHKEIHDGDHYFVQSYADLAINHVLDFTWLMPNTTRWTHWTWRIDTESETLWQIYEPAVATNPLANIITPRNSNRNFPDASGTVMLFEDQVNLAAANADTNVAAATLLADGVSGSGRDAGMSSRQNEVVMRQNTLYCLRATASAAGYINFNMNWYEHTDQA